jgi:hypothetical protein
MSAIDAVTAVWTRLAAVEGIGPNVYNMLRAAITSDEFNAIFVNTTPSTLTPPLPNLVQAWQVTREATAAKDEVLNAMSRTHDVVMYGYMAFQDNVSEPIFQALLETVCAAFDTYAQPTGSSLRRFVSEAFPMGQFDWSGPTQVESVKLGMLGSVLVHAARLVYPVREFPL